MVRRLRVRLGIPCWGVAGRPSGPGAAATPDELFDRMVRREVEHEKKAREGRRTSAPVSRESWTTSFRTASASWSCKLVQRSRCSTLNLIRCSSPRSIEETGRQARIELRRLPVRSDAKRRGSDARTTARARSARDSLRAAAGELGLQVDLEVRVERGGSRRVSTSRRTESFRRR